MQRAVEPMTTTLPTTAFEEGLTTRFDPSFLRPLEHLISTDGPSGLISGLIEPTWSAGTPTSGRTIAPVAARQMLAVPSRPPAPSIVFAVASGAPPVQRLTEAPPVDMPILDLPVDDPAVAPPSDEPVPPTEPGYEVPVELPGAVLAHGSPPSRPARPVGLGPPIQRQVSLDAPLAALPLPVAPALSSPPTGGTAPGVVQRSDGAVRPVPRPGITAEAPVEADVALLPVGEPARAADSADPLVDLGHTPSPMNAGTSVPAPVQRSGDAPPGPVDPGTPVRRLSPAVETNRSSAPPGAADEPVVATPTLGRAAGDLGLPPVQRTTDQAPHDPVGGQMGLPSAQRDTARARPDPAGGDIGLPPVQPDIARDSPDPAGGTGLRPLLGVRREAPDARFGPSPAATAPPPDSQEAPAAPGAPVGPPDMPVVSRLHETTAPDPDPSQVTAGGGVAVEPAPPVPQPDARPTLGEPLLAAVGPQPHALPPTAGPGTVQRWSRAPQSNDLPGSGSTATGAPTLGMMQAAPGHSGTGAPATFAVPSVQRRSSPPDLRVAPGTVARAAVPGVTHGGSREAPTLPATVIQRFGAAEHAAMFGHTAPATVPHPVAVQRRSDHHSDDELEPPDEVWSTEDAGGSSVLGPRSAAPPLAGTPIPDAVGAPTAPLAGGEGGGHAASGHAARSGMDREQLDSLADDLYDKIRNRLRSELRVDRERRGRVTDLAG